IAATMSWAGPIGASSCGEAAKQPASSSAASAGVTGRKRGTADIAGISGLGGFGSGRAVAAEQVADVLPETAFGIWRKGAGHDRELPRTLAARLRGLAVDRVDPGHFQAFARLRRKGARGQVAEQVLPGAQATGGAEQAGRLVVVASHPEHRQPVAGEAGEPAVAQVVAGAGLAGGIEPGQRRIAQA